MTPDERDRLLTLEINARNQDMSIARMAGQMDDMAAKLDELLKAAHMGQGAWWVILRIGAGLTAVAAAFAAVVSAVVWALEKFHVLK